MPTKTYSFIFFTDDSTFKDILKFICDNDLLQVKAIIWNVLPNVRRDALLTKQARLIDLFKPKEIWHNVVIVCKQSRNPEDDAQGALAAARQFNPHADPPILGYTFIDDASLTLNQRRRFEKAPSLRDDFLVKNDDEVRRDIFRTISTLKESILGKISKKSILNGVSCEFYIDSLNNLNRVKALLSLSISFFIDWLD